MNMELLPKLKKKEREREREKKEKSWYVGTFYPLNIHSFLPSWNMLMNSRNLTSFIDKHGDRGLPAVNSRYKR